jgi:peptidyl-Lys metalloendopeptidase
MMPRMMTIRATRWAAILLVPLFIAGCSVQGDSNPAPTQTSSPQPAQRDLGVTLTLHQSAYMQGDAVIADVTITNLTKHNVKLLSWFMPSSELEEATFVITRGGARTDFLGPHYKRPHAVAGDFVHVAAGETITGQVDLARFYDFSVTGDYAIQFDTELKNLAPNLATVGQVTSNIETVWIEARVTAAPAPDPIEPGPGNLGFSGRCSSTQQQLIAEAVNGAQIISSNASNYLSSTPSGTPRYTEWFGAYTTSRWATVNDNFISIADAFSTAPIVVDCKCKKPYYAYVYPNQPYKIYVCKAFWSAPTMGSDSKAGTLVHEMSHFSVVAGTDDVVYGQSGCRSLALSNPDDAIRNADSHEYFAENTPVLP